MPNDAFTQQALAADPIFRSMRVKNSLAAVAWEVLVEAPPPGNHAARATYARLVLSDLDGYTDQIVDSLVTRPNLMNVATSFSGGSWITAATDADIKSQLSTDWNNLAGA